MPHAPFVPLRVFSSYTMLEGAFEPKAIAKSAKALRFPAVAVCDRNGLYAAMPFADACIGDGVQPIIGALVSVARASCEGAGGDAANPVLDWLALYAQDEAGYTNLCHIVSEAHLSPEHGLDPHVRLDQLEDYTDGLLCLTAGAEGALARLLAEGQDSAALPYVERLESLFAGRLYIELARRKDAVEEAAEAKLIAMAYARDLPLVATNPCCFAERDFHAAHDALLCIAQSAYIESDDRRKSSPEAWLKSAEAMEDLFSDLPEALANTLVVAQRCAVRAPKRDPILPSLAGNREAEAEQLRRDAYEGLVARLRKVVSRDLFPREGGGPSPEIAAKTPFALDAAAGDGPLPSQGNSDVSDADLESRFPDYFERLTFECDVIVGMGFPGYFLIVADFIKWAKSHDIPVGPGRGSGATAVR